jgi:MFS family permease
VTTPDTTSDRQGFSKLVAASTISNVGDGVFLVALPLLATELTRDPTAIAGVLLAIRLPWLVCSLFAGEIADRVDRRRLIWRSDIARAAILVALAILVAADRASITALYIIAILLGVGETFRDNAAQVIVASLVPPQRLEWANGRLASLETVTNRFLGPPLGGLLVTIGLTVPFVFDAATFAAAAAAVALISGHYRAAAARPSQRILPGIATGLRWLWQHTQLRILALLLGALTFLATAGEAILVLYAQDVVGVDDVGFGLLISAGAAGAVVSGVLTARIVRRVGRHRVLITAALLYGAAQVALGLTTSAWLFGIVMATGAFSAVAWNVVTVSLRQTLVPDHLLGRVNSAYRFFGWGAMPLGALLGGLIAEHANLHVPFIAGGTLMITATLVATPSLRGINAITSTAPA